MSFFKTEKSKLYFQNTSWPILEKLYRVFISFFISTFVIRFLGPDLFGKLSYAQSILMIASVFTTLGLDGVIVRNLVQEKGQTSQILGTYTFLRFSAGLIVTILLNILAFSGVLGKHFEGFNTLILILSLQYIFQFTSVFDLYFQATIQNKKIVISNTIGLTIASALRLALIILVGTKNLYLYGAVISLEFILIGFSLFTQYKFKDIKDWKVDFQYSKELLKEGFPYILSSIFVTLYMKVDQLMIEHYLGATALGTYSAAARLSETLYFIPAAISNSLFPSIMDSFNDEETFLHKFQNLFSLLTWMALAMAFFATILGPFAINLLYGSEYHETINIFKVLIWTGVFVFFGIAKSKWIVAKKLQNLNLLYVLIGMVLNIILNILIIPQYGALGAAYTTLITQMTVSVIAPLFFKEDRQSCTLFIKSFNIVSLYKYLRTKI